ncbi:hypothetical protein BDV98DRAFT_493565, partial [Pterulicium gracile]
IIVDDFDPRITYTPSDKWTTGGGELEHNSTTHRFNDGAGSFAFTFNGQFFGTGIQVYGTLVEETSSKSPFIATFQIDDSPPVTYTSPSMNRKQYRRQFFRSAVLEENVEHRLVI